MTAAAERRPNPLSVSKPAAMAPRNEGSNSVLAGSFALCLLLMGLVPYTLYVLLSGKQSSDTRKGKVRWAAGRQGGARAAGNTFARTLRGYGPAHPTRPGGARRRSCAHAGPVPRRAAAAPPTLR